MADILDALQLTTQAYRDGYRMQRPMELIVAKWKEATIDPTELQAWRDLGYVVTFVGNWNDTD